MYHRVEACGLMQQLIHVVLIVIFDHLIHDLDKPQAFPPRVVLVPGI